MPRATTRAARTRDEDEDTREEETTSRRSRRDDDDDADERPRSRTRSSRRDDDDADETPRRPARRRARDDDDDDRPTRRTRSRREDSDDEDDDRESRRASRSEGAREATSTSMGRGRESLRRHRETHKSKSGFPDKLKVDEDKRVLVKFVDDDFFITYYEHNLYNDFKGQKRQFSFVCLGEDCPLCEIGDDPKFQVLINVIDMSNPRKPELKVWYASPGPGGLIEDEMDALEELGKERHPDEPKKWKRINDPSLYYVVSKKKGKNNFFEYSLKQVKARDLEEDGYGEPLTDDELAEFEDKAYTEEIVRLNTRRDLREIADELSED